MPKQKQPTALAVAQEAAILTVAVAIIAAAVYLTDLHSGATVYESYGAYNMEKRREIITIVDKGEYQKLMDFMNREDPRAFITVYTVSDMRYQPKP